MLYMAIFILIAVLGGANFYLAHRVWRWVHCFVPKFSIVIPLAAFLLMTVLMVLSFIKPFSGLIQRYVSIVGATWMGMIVYLLLFFLLSDLIILIVWLLRILPASAMEKLRLAAGIGATALALIISIYGILNARCVHTKEYDIQLSESPASELTVALISDVHLGAVGSESRLEKIVAEINSLSPDIVCIAGDLFDTDFGSIIDPENAIQTLKQISAPYGVYACLGNHDSGKTIASMEEFMVRAGIRLLKDDHVIINERLVLAGRLDPSPIGGAGELKRGEMADVLKDSDPNLPVVVLDHNPINVDTYQNEADLILSGHTHKGQIFPGSLFTNAMFAVDYGYYRSEHGTQAIVTSGAGTWGLPMRVGTNCEIVRINLKY